MKRRFRIAAALVTFAFAALIVGFVVRSHSFARKVRTIRVGDSKETVLASLGSPTAVMAPPEEFQGGWYLGVRVETWAYGKSFDWQTSSEFPYFWQFRLRLFGPDEDDVAIEFDPTGRVSHVIVPTQ